MAGSAIVRRLKSEHCELLTVGREDLDLRQQAEVEAWMHVAQPQAVFVAAGTVGGILANSTRPAEFLYDNLAIEANVIHAAWRCDVEKLLFLGSSCIYPRLAPQPMTEEALLSGPLEPTNEWYAIAKIAGIKLCQAYRRQYGCDFISAMPTNLYGPGGNYDPQSSHVAAAMQVKVHQEWPGESRRSGRRSGSARRSVTSSIRATSGCRSGAKRLRCRSSPSERHSAWAGFVRSSRSGRLALKMQGEPAPSESTRRSSRATRGIGS